MDARRGYVPEDEADFSPEAIKKMQSASRHILYLMGEGYDLKSASAFVGNHFMLSERQRMAIARSVALPEHIRARNQKEKTKAEGETVWIDGFNTIITLEVMLSRSPLLSCMDGTIRDLAGLRGSYRIIDQTGPAVDMMLGALKELKADKVRILLDEPVSHSGKLKALIADRAETYPFSLDISLDKRVDSMLWDKENVITSDAIILDHCISWINLLKTCICRYRAETITVW